MNQPVQLAKVLAALEHIQGGFDGRQKGRKRISLADLVVLAGNCGIEKAAAAGGHTTRLPFRPGRTDATQEQTDVESFGVLEPIADGFRNYCKPEAMMRAEARLVDRAQLLTLTAPEMTVLVGGLRVLGANIGNSSLGVLTLKPGRLSNDFFVNLLDMRTEWVRVPGQEGVFAGLDRATGERRWGATRVDLIFGSNAQLRALAEVYGSSGGEEKFVRDFAAAWTKVMELDRFELRRGAGTRSR